MGGMPDNTHGLMRRPLKDNVVVAVNVGGPRVTDSNGIVYVSDDTSNKGAAYNNWGKKLLTGVPIEDVVLYISFRIYPKTESFYLPDLYDGHYVLVLKFCDHAITSANVRLFNIKLGDISVLQNFDIYTKVGNAHPHDEQIPFRVSSNGTALSACGKTLPLSGSFQLTMENVKNDALLCAFYIARGTPQSLNIKLPLLPRYLMAAKNAEQESQLEQEEYPLPPYPVAAVNAVSSAGQSISTCTDAQQLMRILQRAVDGIALSQDQLALAGPLLSLTGTALLAVGKYLEDKAQNGQQLKSKEKSTDDF